MKTSAEEFDRKTILLPAVIAETCLERRLGEAEKPPSQEQVNYFVSHSESWIRYFHANDKKWKKKIEENDRDFLYQVIDHWADGFLSNPRLYIQRHPMSALD